MLERPSVEYNLTDHCNLRCTGCARGSPLLDDNFADIGEFAADLRALARGLHAGEIRLGGGEPLLHPELFAFLRAARASGIADKVVLITNGVLLHEAPEELWRLIDGMWLSLYPGVTLRTPIAECERLAALHGVELSVRRADEFSHILLNQRNEDARGVELVYRRCKAAREWSCHTIHDGRFYKCSTAPFTEQRMARLRVPFEESSRDYVRLDAPNLTEALDEYMKDERPLAACAYCLGSSGPAFPNRQLNNAALAASMVEDHRRTTQLVGQILRTEHDRDGLRDELQQVRAALDDVHGSWSWRLMAPARSLLRALRGR